MTDNMKWGLLIGSLIIDLTLIIGMLVRPEMQAMFGTFLGVFGFGQFLTFFIYRTALLDIDTILKLLYYINIKRGNIIWI
jgi:hypothetical protein